jgi:hypothetical protein
VTGTPLTSHGLSDVQGLLHVLQHQPFSDPAAWKKLVGAPYEQGGACPGRVVGVSEHACESGPLCASFFLQDLESEIKGPRGQGSSALVAPTVCCLLHQTGPKPWYTCQARLLSL